MSSKTGSRNVREVRPAYSIPKTPRLGRERESTADDDRDHAETGCIVIKLRARSTSLKKPPPSISIIFRVRVQEILKGEAFSISIPRSLIFSQAIFENVTAKKLVTVVNQKRAGFTKDADSECPEKATRKQAPFIVRRHHGRHAVAESARADSP